MSKTDLMQQLRQRMLELGMSNGELSRASGVGKSQIGKYLRGESSPSVAVYERLVGGLDSRSQGVRARQGRKCNVEHFPGSKSQRACPDHGYQSSLRNRVSVVGESPSLGAYGSHFSISMGEIPVTYDEGALNLDLIKHSDPVRSRLRLRASLVEAVWDTASLEGNTCTLPEVRTLIDGISVGGRTVQETEQVLNIKDAFLRLDSMLANGEFDLSKGTSDTLHAIVARSESIDAGMFRGEGTAQGGGHVRLSTGDRVEGFPHGEGGESLFRMHDVLLGHIDSIEDVRMQALVYFASAARTQFYFDGNKRTARLMMTGHLVANGYDAVSIRNSQRLEYNEALDTMFSTGDSTDLMVLLSESSID